MSRDRRSASLPALLLMLALAAGCSDGSGPNGGSLLAGRWAGAVWVGRGEALLLARAPIDTLYLFGVRETDSDVPEEVVRIRVPFSGAGTYSLSGDAVEFTVLVGGDAVGAEYGGRGSHAGTLVVDSYRATAEIISGTLTFDATAISGYQPYGATPSFTGGRFRAIVRPGR